jgi:magnesium transporter
MANLPKIRRGQGRGRGPADEPRADRVGPDVQRLEAHGLTWLNIESPTQLETAWLAEHYDFHPLDLEDVLSRRRQRAKIDEYADYLFIVLHFPRFDKRAGRLQAAELNLFVAEELVIMLPNEPLKPLSALWSRCERSEAARDQFMGRGSGFLLYEIVDTMYDYCFPILDKIGFKLDSLEDAMFEGRSREVVRDLSNAKQEIINFRKVVKPQRTTLRLLERNVQRYAPQDLELYFDDIVDKSERIWDLLENYKEVVEALESTNESVIAHDFNDVLRILTVFSIVFLPATLIASIWGMNIGLPGGGDPETSSSVVFWIVMAAMVLFVAAMLAYFRHKRWL